MYIPRLRIALLFYRYHCFVPTLLWLPGIWVYSLDGLLLPLLLMKAAVNGLLWYLISTTRHDRFYYYYNLHVSRPVLFLTWFFTDLLLFGISLWATALMW
ncbi:hypothetical protein GCM10023093_09350 [Nemorincola caseinilytica]|uniref:Succinate dehydrogenase subunit 4 n=1 Tax=Nemorincola caseinilytica TaxID=2054315 RepID=A0ABP8N7G5_9BACT